MLSVFFYFWCSFSAGDLNLWGNQSKRMIPTLPSAYAFVIRRKRRGDKVVMTPDFHVIFHVIYLFITNEGVRKNN